MKQSFVLAVVLLTLSACATNPDAIAPAKHGITDVYASVNNQGDAKDIEQLRSALIHQLARRSVQAPGTKATLVADPDIWIPVTIREKTLTHRHAARDRVVEYRLFKKGSVSFQ